MATVHRPRENDSDVSIPLWLLVLMGAVGLVFATGLWLGPLCLVALLFVVWPTLVDELAVRRTIRQAVDNSLHNTR